MKNNFKLICVFFAIGYFISGCFKSVEWNGETGYFKDCEKIAVLEVIISPPELPVAPLIDAALYNAKFEKIIPNVIEEQQICVNRFDTFLGETLQSISNCKVLYGNYLYNSKEYRSLRSIVKTFDLSYNDDDFPEINIPDGAYNFFDFYDTQHPLFYFEDDEILIIIKPRIATIAKELGVSGLIIGVSTEIVLYAGLFGSTGAKFLKTKIYYFNSEGDLMANGISNSDASTASASSLSDYIFHLNKYQENTYKIIREIDNNYFNKEVEEKIKSDKEIIRKVRKRSTKRIKE